MTGGAHGFDGRISALTSRKTLEIHKVFPAVLRFVRTKIRAGKTAEHYPPIF